MPPEPAPLQGKVVIVTGATSGVGTAVVSAMCALGASVHAVGRSVAGVAALAKNVESKQLTTWHVDLDDDASIRQFSDSLSGRATAVHALVHCAGVLERREIAAQAVDDADRHFRTNARAPMMLTTRLLPQLRAGRADVIFLNSSAAPRPSAGLAAYAMSKAALTAFADTLRIEENQHGLRVLTIYLGRTATPMQEKLALQERSRYDGGRLIQVEEVATIISGALQLGANSEITDLTLRPRQPPRR